MGTVFPIHLATTLVMVGIIWFVQLIHYPLFGRVDAKEFPAYSQAHSRLTGLVAGPQTLAEAATTALLQAPRHTDPGLGFDAYRASSSCPTGFARPSGAPAGCCPVDDGRDHRPDKAENTGVIRITLR